MFGEAEIIKSMTKEFLFWRQRLFRTHAAYTLIKNFFYLVSQGKFGSLQFPSRIFMLKSFKTTL